MRRTASARGRLIQEVLAGAWRAEPPRLALRIEDLEDIIPALVNTWIAALAWWRLRRTELRECAGLGTLHDAFRHYRLRAALAEREIVQIVTRLRRAGVDPILAKGWTVARLYPDVGVRPFVDVDLFVRPEQHGDAKAALTVLDRTASEFVDLHSGIRELDDRDLGSVYRRTRTIAINGVEARILGAEDELRFLCLHLAGHFFRWPLPLCDIGAGLERLPAGFDWAYCLSGAARRSTWVLAALLLAHRLLGVPIAHLPREARTIRLPGWLASDVLREWGAPRPPLVAMAAAGRDPRKALAAVATRWPSGTEATLRLDGSLNVLPRFPLQLRTFLARAVRFQTKYGALYLRG